MTTPIPSGTTSRSQATADGGVIPPSPSTVAILAALDAHVPLLTQVAVPSLRLPERFDCSCGVSGVTGPGWCRHLMAAEELAS